MTSSVQRAKLQAQIWKIANEVRGSVDGWDFKHFVLGTLFYRFISENFTNYIEAGDESIDYANLSDDVITPEIKERPQILILPQKVQNEIALILDTTQS